MRPPTPYSCAHSVNIPMPPAETNAFLENAENFLAFWASPGGRTASSTELIAPGTILEYPLALGPLTLSWIAVVSQFRPDERIVLRSTHGPVDARTTVRWEPHAEAPELTRVTLSVRGRAARRWVRFPGLVTAVTDRHLAASCQRLAKTVQACTDD